MDIITGSLDCLMAEHDGGVVHRVALLAKLKDVFVLFRQIADGYNVRGAVVETRNINVMNGATMNFNHNLDAGTYFVRIISGDKVYVEQIVVE